MTREQALRALSELSEYEREFAMSMLRTAKMALYIDAEAGGRICDMLEAIVPEMNGDPFTDKSLQDRAASALDEVIARLLPS